MNEQDLLFRCHCLSDFASTSAEENKNPYFATLKAIEKTKCELETLKQAKAIEARNELLVELNAKLEEYEPFKDKVYLSKTAHKRILKMAREIKYGIRENLENKYVLKGLMNEEDAISLWSDVSGKFLTKNEQRFYDELKQGEMDILTNYNGYKCVDDIKNSFTKETFDNNINLSKKYYWQLQGYMDLLGESYQYGRIVFTLTNTPIELILDEVRQTAWKYYKNEQRTLTGADFRSFMEDFPIIDDYINFNEDFKPLKTQIFRNHIFADSGWVNEGEGRITNIKDGYWQYLTDTYLLNEDYVFRPVPKEERVKIFLFNRNDDDINFINSQLQKAKPELLKLLETRQGIEIIELTKELCDNDR